MGDEGCCHVGMPSERDARRMSTFVKPSSASGLRRHARAPPARRVDSRRDRPRSCRRPRWGNRALGRRDEPAPELRLTVVAAIARIRGIARIVELLGVELEHRSHRTLGDVAGRRPLARPGYDALRPMIASDVVGAERLARRHREIGGVHATAVPDRDGRVDAEPRRERARLRRQSGFRDASRSSAMSIEQSIGRAAASAVRPAPAIDGHRSGPSALSTGVGVAIMIASASLLRFSAMPDRGPPTPPPAARVDRDVRLLRRAGRMRPDVSALRASWRQPGARRRRQVRSSAPAKRDCSQVPRAAWHRSARGRGGRRARVPAFADWLEPRRPRGGRPGGACRRSRIG